MTQTQKHVVVTGASSGIGAATVVGLHAAGMVPIPMVRKQADLDALNALCGTELFGVLADVTDMNALRAAAQAVQARLGEGGVLAGLVNNAGIAPPGPMMFQDFDEWSRVMDINCLGVVRASQAFGPLLGVRDPIVENAGRIVNVTSIAGQVGWPYLSAYSASKHAVEGLSDSVRRELMPYGVDVIIVGPGAVKTPIWGKAQAYDLSRYDGTPYSANLQKFVNGMERDGKKGLEPEVIADVIVKALTAKNPKPRYAPVPKPISGWLLPRFMPKRWLDGIMADMLGFRKK